MSGDKIIQKIEEEAKQDAAAIGAAAQEKARKEKERILAKAQEEVREIQAKSQVDAKEAAGRLQLIAELQSRKENLASKRKVLQEAFDRAAGQLEALPQEQWEKLIGRIVLGSDLTGRETLVVPAKDRHRYENGFLARLNGELKAQGREGALALSDKAADFADGVLIEGENCDYDGSFATLLEDVRTGEEYRVAELLFGAEVK
ncbi:V-type ATP synthase subunit E [Acidaminococcus massiliensis]|uniref:V-type ATP synthase subunit E n=1 Tax=Acidaminococcus massiliensis TaxID=1852375 RepID=UPI003521DCC1